MSLSYVHDQVSSRY